MVDGCEVGAVDVVVEARRKGDEDKEAGVPSTWSSRSPLLIPGTGERGALPTKYLYY